MITSPVGSSACPIRTDYRSFTPQPSSTAKRVKDRFGSERSVANLAGCERTPEFGHFGARALLASPKSMNTGYKNQDLAQWSWIPGPALKGRPGTTGEFFRSLLGRGSPDSGHSPAE
jgi:hypothetical protein